MSRNRRSHYPRRSVVDEETPAEDVLDSLPEEKAQDIEEPEEKQVGLCSRCRTASSLDLRDVKNVLDKKGWDYTTFRHEPAVELTGTNAEVWYDDQPGVEPGWMFSYPDGDDEFIDSVRELEDALDIVESKWGKTACENCQRIRQAKSDWQFGSSLFRSRYKAIEAAIESWMDRSRDREVSRRELGELKDYVNQGVTKQTPGRGDGPSLAELRNGVDEAELKDILQDLGMRVSRTASCKSCGRDIQAQDEADKWTWMESVVDKMKGDPKFSRVEGPYKAPYGSSEDASAQAVMESRRGDIELDLKAVDWTKQAVAKIPEVGGMGMEYKEEVLIDTTDDIKPRQFVEQVIKRVAHRETDGSY